MDDQLQERRKRQLMIMNGIRDPDALEELLNEKGENATGKTEVTMGRL